MRNKSEKGVTLIALTITIIVLLILTSIIITNGTKQLGLKKVNNLEVDIESISSKITDYYLKNASLPVFERGYFSNKEEFNAFLTQKNITKVEDIINPNDEGFYYVIDLSKIEGLTLNYGEKYKEWTNDSSTYNNLQDIYIINETSHQIYYPQGIKFANVHYFTTNIQDEEVEAITMNSESEVLNFSVTNVKIETLGNSLISVNSNIQVIINENFNINSLEYAWTTTSPTEPIESNLNSLNLQKFTIDNMGNATLRSKSIDENIDKVYLWVKVLDKNGDAVYDFKTIQTLLKPTEMNVTGNTTFSTDYGTIDVIWLYGTGNSVSATPNAPILTSNGESMTPVKWTETTGGWSDTPVETTSSDVDWYRYNSVSTREESGLTTDNTTSKWANAKTANGAYFVWIPRYAYRITYYSSQTSTEPTGYFDGWGLWSASEGCVKLALDSGIETVIYNGNKYIVHPAFETNLDLGGWSSDLSGFWFAKYEMSGNSYSNLTSVPNVASLRSKIIGIQYLYGRQATYGFNGTSETLFSNGTNYTYTSYMNSHVTKNSEWGAVAYLAHSGYGRNGKEIDINNSTSYRTGNGGGAVSGTAQTASGITYAYNTEMGAKASTTGNVYGIYDMSGGSWERTASFYSEASSVYVEGSDYGLLMTQEAKDSSGNYISTKYITKYGGTTSNVGNAVLYTYGKIGDSTKEVNTGGNYVNSSTTSKNGWFNDYALISYSPEPFLTYGGYNGNRALAGIFCFYRANGGSYGSISFRTALCP